MSDTQDPVLDTLLAHEAQQIHEYVRAIGLLVITWFAMFGTINSIAIGWFAESFGSGTSYSILSILLIGIFFISQSCIAIVALRPMRQYLDGAAQRLVTILELQAGGSTSQSIRPQPQGAPSLYSKIVGALIATMASFVVVWAALTLIGVAMTLGILPGLSVPVRP
jgi:hypothetical protein